MSDPFRNEVEAAHERIGRLEAELRAQAGPLRGDVVGKQLLDLEDKWTEGRDRFRRRFLRTLKIVAGALLGVMWISGFATLGPEEHAPTGAQQHRLNAVVEQLILPGIGLLAAIGILALIGSAAYASYDERRRRASWQLLVRQARMAQAAHEQVRVAEARPFGQPPGPLATDGLADAEEPQRRLR